MKINTKIILISSMLLMSYLVSRNLKKKTKDFFCNYESTKCPTHGEICCEKNGSNPGRKIFQCRHACEATLSWSHHHLANVVTTGGARCRLVRQRSDMSDEEEYHCSGGTFDTK